MATMSKRRERRQADAKHRRIVFAAKKAGRPLPGFGRFWQEDGVSRDLWITGREMRRESLRIVGTPMMQIAVSSAPVEDLVLLPGIGPRNAAKIVTARENGIGTGRFEIKTVTDEETGERREDEVEILSKDIKFVLTKILGSKRFETLFYTDEVVWD